MARPKRVDSTTSGFDDLVSDLQTALNKNATSAQGYLEGDHAENTWGVKIPYLAFQYFIGGSDVLPAQRFIGVSGEAKSFKSTLVYEIGNWFRMDGGFHAAFDTENKTSASMLRALSFGRDINPKSRFYKVCASVDEWQKQMTTAILFWRERGRAEKGSRVPVWVTIDSLNGRGTEDADADIRKEGMAVQRGFPIANLQITNYLQGLNLMGTTVSAGWVQHMKDEIATKAGYGGPQKVEKGAKAAAFASSAHIRVAKGTLITAATHPGAYDKNIPVEGHTLYMHCVRGCVGPDDRRLQVDLLWQYVPIEVPNEEGVMVKRQQQYMWFDWDGALGELLWSIKYNEKHRPKIYGYHKDLLNEALFFTQPKTNQIKCEALGLDGVSYTEFGKAIRENAEIHTKVSEYLNIEHYPSVQDANIDFTAGDLTKKPGRG